jgi:hypothetical protein
VVHYEVAEKGMARKGELAMELQREYARGNLVGNGVITVVEGRRELAFDVVTISACGLLVETTESLETGDEVRVKVDISGRFDRTFKLDGVVLSRAREGDRWQLAIKIKKIAPQDRIEIDEMVRFLNTYNANFCEGLTYDEDKDSDLAVNWPDEVEKMRERQK